MSKEEEKELLSEGQTVDWGSMKLGVKGISASWWETATWEGKGREKETQDDKREKLEILPNAGAKGCWCSSSVAERLSYDSESPGRADISVGGARCKCDIC